jgi:hypothetical protein
MTPLLPANEGVQRTESGVVGPHVRVNLVSHFPYGFRANRTVGLTHTMYTLRACSMAAHVRKDSPSTEIYILLLLLLIHYVGSSWPSPCQRGKHVPELTVVLPRALSFYMSHMRTRARFGVNDRITTIYPDTTSVPYRAAPL